MEGPVLTFIQPLSQNHLSNLNNNITPQDLAQEQDMLLLAGSKVSFREIYAQEIDLPVFKGKYYTAKDVDNLFVVLNGVLTSVSEQAFRNDKALSTAREALSSAEKDVESIKNKLNESEVANNNMVQEISQLKQEISQLKQEIATLDDISNKQASSLNDEKLIQQLTQQLEDKSNDYTRLLESASSKMSEQATIIENLTDENENLKLQLQSVIDELQDLSNSTSDTELQSEFNILQYKYENLKTLATKRIQELTYEMNTIKELENVK